MQVTTNANFDDGEEDLDLMSTYENTMTELGCHLDVLISAIADVNRANGWYDHARTFGEDIALLHSEVSEVFEGYRKGDRDNVREELADVLIRLLDTWDRQGYGGVRLIAEVVAKVEKNRARGFQHGGKAL